jgi:hypothetical protein
MTKPNLRNLRPSWPAVLLFTALLAQAPHAAAVFIRIAPHDAQWEIVTSFIDAWVYAIALESATAYFVWRSKLRWAIAFALFSIAHNIAYYMPGAWTFDVFGATLTVRYVFSALLISMSLPIAIAAFSHVQAETPHSAATPQPIALPPDAATAPLLPPAGQLEAIAPEPARAREHTAVPGTEGRAADASASTGHPSNASARGAFGYTGNAHRLARSGDAHVVGAVAGNPDTVHRRARHTRAALR